MKMYLYPKCTTCQKAVRFLNDHKIAFISIDIKQNPPTIDELEQMVLFYQGDFKKLFNTSGMLYREFELKEKMPDLSLREALQLLHQNGMLIKRPFLLAKNRGAVGFKAEEWKKFL